VQSVTAAPRCIGKEISGICLVRVFIDLQPATDRITPAEEGQRDCTGRNRLLAVI